MTTTLEQTTDYPLPIHGEDASPEQDREHLTDTSELHWEDGGLPSDLQKGMETLRERRELTDVVLSVDGHDFPCHRVVLAAASQYFR